MKSDLRIIKKLYGEKMAHFCRDNFATILENDGLLLKLMLDNFEPNHNLYTDIMQQEIDYEFKNYIYGLIDLEKNNKIESNKNPQELLSEVGYELYECHTEKDIQNFKKYYAPGEELCTFNGGRLKRCYVFFAVKKDVDTIKREDYHKPERQDRYGTSVISIQFTKDDAHILSIKNRYNHTVNNPDSTFSNNLDNIIPGLTESFANEYGLVQKYHNNALEINGYVKANDGKFYKYNYELDNIYYCPNNIIIDHYEVKRYEKEKYLILDYFILDLVNKRVSLYDKKIKDSFKDTVKDIERVTIEKDNLIKVVELFLKNGQKVKIVIDESSRIIKLENLFLQEIRDKFLSYNTTIQEINLPEVQEIGDYFLNSNELLQSIKLEKLKKVGDNFLCHNNALKEIYLPNLEKTGIMFLYMNENLRQLNLPKLQIAGDYFLGLNYFLQELNLPEVKAIGNKFLNSNKCIRVLNLPKVQIIGDKFMYNNRMLQVINIPNLEVVGNEFLYNNVFVAELNCPKLFIVGNRFLYYNNSLKILDLPSLKKVGNYFLGRNNSLQEVTLLNLQSAKDCFMFCNETVQKFDAPNLEEFGVDFFKNNFRINLGDRNIKNR